MMKQVVQVLGSIVYTFIFSALMYVLMVWPLMWFVGLSGFWKFIVFFIFAGLIQGLITMTQVFATMPYVWLLKENKIATYLSVGILVINIIVNIVFVWKNCVGTGVGMIIFAIIATVLLIEVLFGTIPNIMRCYTGEISKQTLD